MKLNKLPEPLEEQIPEELRVIRDFYFKEINEDLKLAYNLA